MLAKVAVYLVLAAGLAAAASPEVERAHTLFQKTDYPAVIKVLAPVANSDAEAAALSGQAWYMQADFKRAVSHFERAVALAPSESNHYLWLGRAYGRRAETSSFVTAPGYAAKARDNFEKAVQLNPRNIEAINDLFEYYLEAPGFLGGGFDKASGLAERIRQLDPAEYYYAKSRLAEKRKEFQTAEQQLRRAIDLAPKQVGRVLDLAKFLSKQGRYQESDAAFEQANKIAPNDPKILFERASTYINSGRNLEAARQMLRQYLQSPLTPDDPPRREAEALLKKAG